MCTVFHVYKADDKNIVGKNYDIKGGCPIAVFINKRGVLKTAVIKPPDIPAIWKSRFGSVTFNAVGAEFPVRGDTLRALCKECGRKKDSSAESIVDRVKRQILKDTQ